MWLTKKLTPAKLPQIGRWFGCSGRPKDQSTVIHALRTIDDLLVKKDEGVMWDMLTLLPKFPNVLCGNLNKPRTLFEIPVPHFAELAAWLTEHDHSCPYAAKQTVNRLAYEFTPHQNGLKIQVRCLCEAYITMGI